MTVLLERVKFAASCAACNPATCAHTPDGLPSAQPRSLFTWSGWAHDEQRDSRYRDSLSGYVYSARGRVAVAALSQAASRHSRFCAGRFAARFHRLIALARAL